MFETWNILDWTIISLGAIVTAAWLILQIADHGLDLLRDCSYELAKRNGETVGGLSDKYFDELTKMPKDMLDAYDNATSDKERKRIIRKFRWITFSHLA